MDMWIGTEKGFEDVVGIDGYGGRNVNDENILETCQSRRLKILNTMFKKEDKKKNHEQEWGYRDTDLKIARLFQESNV